VIARWIASRVVVILVIVCACLGAGCSDRRARSRIDDSGPPVRGGTLEIVGRSDVDHLATTSAGFVPTFWLFRTFTRQLLSYPPAGDFATKTRPVPDLALEVPARGNAGISADSLMYTFHLRRGVRWDSSPPREVTAYDVVRAFKLFCNPVSPVGTSHYSNTIVGLAKYCEQFARVPGTVAAIREFVATHELEGVRAADEFTVVFRLQAPAPDFLNLVTLAFSSPVPLEYLDYLPDSPAFRQHTLSIGPYRIARYIQGRKMLLERNPVWDRACDPIRQAYVDRIRLLVGIDAQLQQLQIEAGTADLSFDEMVPPAEMASLLAIEDPAIWFSPTESDFAAFAFLVVNHVGPNNRGALKQIPMRRAIAWAVDKAAIVQLAGGPRAARPLRQAVVSSAAGYRDGADQYVTPGDRGDPAAARKLLGEAGYASGISLHLAYPTFTWMPLAAQALQASLQRAGFNIDFRPLAQNDLINRLLSNPENAHRGEWDLALMGWAPDWFGEYNGRSVIAPLFDGRRFGQNSPNYGGYGNRDVNALIDRATTARSRELSNEAWSDAARRLMNDVALVPLVEYKAAYARSRRVRNCTWDALGLNCDITALWLADATATPGWSR